MGLLTNVTKKNESAEDRKILVNIHSRIEDLKLQNMENAKFLRGLSRRIESELEQIREAEANRSIEVKDDSELISSIERVQQTLEEINNNDVMEGIGQIHQALGEMNHNDVLQKLEMLTQTMGQMNNDDVLQELKTMEQTLRESMPQIDTEKLAAMTEQIEAVNNEITQLSQAVTQNSEKVNSLASMQGSIRSLIEAKNNDMSKHIEEIYQAIGAEQTKRLSSMKTVIGINIWISILNAGLIIAYILGIFS